jgi:hypothetical protein
MENYAASADTCVVAEVNLHNVGQEEFCHTIPHAAALFFLGNSSNPGQT